MTTLGRLLSSVGYQGMKLGRTGARPADVYLRNQKEIARFGPLSRAMIGGKISLPVTKSSSPNITGTIETDSRGRAALFAIGQILSWIGISTDLSTRAANHSSGQIVVEFRTVTTLRVEPLDLQKNIDRLDSSLFRPEDMDEGNIYIAYEYLLAESLSISASAGGNLSLGAAAKAVGAEGTIEAERTSNSELILTGTSETPLAFACKLARLRLEDGGRWYLAMTEVRKAPLGGPVSEDPVLFDPESLVEIL